LAELLVVDDEPQLLRLIACLLGRDGHEVSEAADGARALELADSTSKFDLALIDLSIPPKGGIELMRTLRAAHPKLRILLTSGSELAPELRDEVVASEASFLQKPFSPRTLSEFAGRVLAGESFPEGLP
jgi:CheY-like chemotaxis protein